MTAVKDAHKENAAFHREVLDTAPGALFQKIAYKSVRDWWEVRSADKELKPSQTCICGQQKKALLARRNRTQRRNSKPASQWGTDRAIYLASDKRAPRSSGRGRLRSRFG